MSIRDFKLPLPEVVDGAVGPFGPYCMGYMNPGASGSGYIASMKLSVDKVDVAGLDPGTEGIVSYDRCEKDDAYIGQINMLTASSFCGVNGALWGYHLAKADAVAGGGLEPLFTYPRPGDPERLPGQEPVPVYPAGPLLDAAVRLFGRMDKHGDGESDRRRFPPMPGAHVICANKDASQRGPGYVWSAIGVAIADDRNAAANLFIEDTGFQNSWADMDAFMKATVHAIAKSMILCGQDQNVLFKEIFAGGKWIECGQDEWGCALACAPYVILARDAIPTGGPAEILDMTISDWEETLGLPPLPPPPAVPGSGSYGC